MALDRHVSRIAKILVDSERITFDEAQKRLGALTLEVVVGADAVSPAAHAAVLTAVSIGRRTFVGGVRVIGAVDQPQNSALPLSAASLGDAVAEVGAADFEGMPSRRVVIGSASMPEDGWSVGVWWNGWKAGTAQPQACLCENSDNPLVGIAAAALAVGMAFQAERGLCFDLRSEIEKRAPQAFRRLFFPGPYG